MRGIKPQCAMPVIVTSAKIRERFPRSNVIKFNGNDSGFDPGGQIPIAPGVSCEVFEQNQRVGSRRPDACLRRSVYRASKDGRE